MAFVLLAAGALLLIATARGSQSQLYALVQGDFTGKNNFIYWFVAILLIGALGYVKALKPISNVFLGLVILVLFISRGGFFAQFTSALATTQTAQPTQPAGTATGPTSSFSSLFPGINNVGSILTPPTFGNSAPLSFPGVSGTTPVGPTQPNTATLSFPGL